jgi:hypothetical protein
VDRRRRLSWSGEIASGEVLGLAPGIWDELAAGTPGPDTPVGVMAHPNAIHRTAVFVTRTYGGVGGGRSRGPSLSRLDGAKGTERIHESSDDSLVPYSEAYPSVRAIAGKLGLGVSTTWRCLKSPALSKRRAME